MAEIGVVETHAGRCFCGSVEIEVAGAPLEMGYCHCDSCRAYSGAPFVAYTLWRAENVRIRHGVELVGRFNKTGMSERHFCTRCGGHLLSHHPALGLTDVHAAALPGIAFAPVVHLNYAQAVLPVRDGLPKLKDFPTEAGGSGETCPNSWSGYERRPSGASGASSPSSSSSSEAGIA